MQTESEKWEEARRFHLENPQYRAACERRYWRDPGLGNLSEDYANAPGYRSEFLTLLVSLLPHRPESILEVGCNCGRNLDALRAVGHGNLTGVDIRDCSAEMAKYFPLLRGNFIWEPAEEALAKMDGPFDLIYSMAALQHMAHESIFYHIARLSRRYVITIENEPEGWPSHYPRNYAVVFEPLGFRQQADGLAILNDEEGPYVVRVFEKAV